MKISEFINDENHMANLGEDQFKEVFDLEAIEQLSNNEHEKQRVYWLSQWLTGNVSEPFECIKKLDKAEQWRVFDTWFDLVKDPEYLREIGKSIVKEFIKGDAL